MVTSNSRISSFRLPNLQCPFTLKYHENGDAIAAASDEWFANGSSNFTESRRRRLNGLKAGQLTAYCYNTTSDYRLKVVCDFMNFVFHIDDLSDSLKTKDTIILADLVMNAIDSPHYYRRTLPDGRELPEEEPDASKLARDFWGRCIVDCGPGCQARYIESIGLFFKAVESEARSRETGFIFDINSYVVHRRDNSGCRPGFDLLEYTLGIDLPDFVIKNDVFRGLSQCANDFVALSNDIFSYNVEQARGDTYNIVVIVMKTRNMELQDAVEHVAGMCRASLESYHEYKAKLPSWAPHINHDVAGYVQGLEDWLSGTFHWTFISKRYFGENVDEVKKTGVVELLPPRLAPANAA